MSINIEREFYIPETFEVQRRFRKEYDSREYIVYEDLTDEYFISYVNQKGSTVYYLQEADVAKSDIIQNVPITGFTIDRNTYSEADYRCMVDGVIIKDPRGFEFKISIRNFLHLTHHHVIDCGEIKAQCILTWSVSGYLTLLSIESESYQNAVEYTAKQHAVFDPENLKIGKTYNIKKSSDEFVYLGKHKINTKSDNYTFEFNLTPSKLIRPVFYNTSTESFVTFILSKNLSGEVSTDIVDTTELLKKFKNTCEGRTVSGFTFSEYDESMFGEHGSAFKIDENGNLLRIRYSEDYRSTDYYNLCASLYEFKNGVIGKCIRDSWYGYSSDVPRNTKKENIMNLIKKYDLKNGVVHFEDELSDDIDLRDIY